MSEHRHYPPGVPEHEFEPVPGLPEALPEQEKIIWQGSPDWKQVAIHIMHIRPIVAYLLLIWAVQGFGDYAETASLQLTLIGLAKTLPFLIMALAGFCYLAWATANNTLYTITSKRIVMRIGIALTITYNLPFSRIAAADLSLKGSHFGDVAIRLQDGDSIGWLNLWPHVRPWKIAHAQPMLRCLPDAHKVANILTMAWQESRFGAHRPALQEERSGTLNPPQNGGLGASLSTGAL
jgi:Bacterial PH domain